MTKKVLLALSCIALLVSFSSAAMADLITFNFLFSSTKTPVAVNQTGLSVVNGATISVSDATTQQAFLLVPGTASLSTGAATSYSNGGGMIDAVYGPGGAVSVVSGLCGGTCLSGNMNGTGTYATTTGKNASFQGLFTVTYVSPYITSLFGLPNTWDANSGADSITTGRNTVLTSTTASAELGGGTISFSTVPEPGTLALMGTGMLGLAGLIRRKSS